MDTTGDGGGMQRVSKFTYLLIRFRLYRFSSVWFSFFYVPLVYRYWDPKNQLSIRGICRKYWDGKYYATFRRRVRSEVRGFEHASGGKGRAKGQQAKGKPNQ